jgi:hypothetical protein
MLSPPALDIRISKDCRDRTHRSLLTGGAVHRATCVTGASPSSGAHPSAGCAASRRCRCPTDQKMQCPVIRSLLRALAHKLRMNRPEPGTSAWIDHRHDDLRLTRYVEHDPITPRPVAGDLDELASAQGLHRNSVLGRPPAVVARVQHAARSKDLSVSQLAPTRGRMPRAHCAWRSLPTCADAGRSLIGLNPRSNHYDEKPSTACRTSG